MFEITAIQKVTIKFLYDKKLEGKPSKFTEVLDYLQKNYKHIEIVQLKRALYDGKSKGFYVWIAAQGDVDEEFFELQIGSYGILVHEEFLETQFFKKVGDDVLRILNKAWERNPTHCFVYYKDIFEEINSKKEDYEKIKDFLYDDIGIYLEDLAKIIRNSYWEITELGRYSLHEINYLIPDSIENVTMDTIIKLKNKLIREGSFLDHNKRVFIEFKSISKGEKLAKTISAFANTKGGHIIIGIFEENSQIKEIKGISPSEVQHVLNSFNHLSPFLEPTKGVIYNEIKLKNGKIVLVFFIPRMPQLYAVKTDKLTYYQRHGESNIPVNEFDLPRLKKEKIIFQKWGGILP